MAFLGCVELSEICLNEGLERAGELCFFKTRVSADQLPERLRKSAQKLGVGLERIGRLALPDTVDVVRRRIFANSDVESVVVPETVSRIGTGAFADCSNLERISFSGAPRLGKIGIGAFENSGLRSFVAPGSLGVVEYGAFSGCDRLESVDLGALGADVTLGESAFSGCARLRVLVLPGGLRKIGSQCFARCGLEQIKIPKSVQEICRRAFYGCKCLAELELESESALNLVGSEAFAGTRLSADSVAFPEKAWVSETAFGPLRSE